MRRAGAVNATLAPMSSTMAALAEGAAEAPGVGFGVACATFAATPENPAQAKETSTNMDPRDMLRAGFDAAAGSNSQTRYVAAAQTRTTTDASARR
jgi:hypothetical protein